MGWIINRPRQSQRLLYKHLRHSLINKLIHPFPPTALQCRHAQLVRSSHSSYKIDYVIVIENFLNPNGHQNWISGSKVAAILLKVWILPIGEVASGRVCACSLRIRLVFNWMHFTLNRQTEDERETHSILARLIF